VALDEAYRLGLGEPLRVSAEHGRGEEELRAAILEVLGAPPAVDPAGPKTAKDPLCVCFIGRPNVGKSSLSNRLLKSDRLIVSEMPGTTRDAIELPFEFVGRDGKNYPFRLIDTAGIKAATKLASPVEYFSRLRSLDAIKKTDVVFLVLDALEGVTQQDKAIAGESIKEGKPIVIVVNKWDLVQKSFRERGGFAPYKSERDYREKYEHALFERLFFTPGSPVIFVSAMSGFEVDRMLNAAVKLNRTLDKKIPTAKLNQTLSYLAERTPPAAVAGRRFRVYYATQTGTRPFRIKLFCNREEKLTEQYRRYLEAGLVEEFDLKGCPIYFDLVGKVRDEVRGSRGGGHASAEQREHTAKWKLEERRKVVED
jgi:GTP-binding protein